MDPGNYPPIISLASLSGNKLQTLGYLTWQVIQLRVLRWHVSLARALLCGSLGTYGPVSRCVLYMLSLWISLALCGPHLYQTHILRPTHSVSLSRKLSFCVS